ncbi:MAG: NYN domain-containing protein [Calothrix sp. C42_A2020_038]|nr:NYN domain-containing protein [Calothrix sp. C42_A2020_038]
MQLLPRPQMNNQLRLKLESEQSHELPNLEVVKKSQPHRSRREDFQQESGRVAIFIDGSNLFYAAMQLNLEIDYAKLLRCLAKDRQLIRAYFYTACDSTNDKQQGFLLWMSRNGYRVVTKELIQFPDGSKKANLDVEIAVDMLTLARHCDTIVLLSGDGDLAYAVNSIAYQGVQVEVVSLASMTSDSLINVADCYTDLEEIKGEIQRKKGE